MTGRTEFGENEVGIVRTLFLAGVALTASDPGPRTEVGNQSMASITASTDPHSGEQPRAHVAAHLQTSVQQRHNPSKGPNPRPKATPSFASVLGS